MIGLKVLTSLEGRAPAIEERVATWLEAELGTSIAANRPVDMRLLQGGHQIMVSLVYLGRSAKEPLNVRYVESTLAEVLTQEFDAETYVQVTVGTL